jgi:putative nucleotidyltransferase with HDIG domain
MSPDPFNERLTDGKPSTDAESVPSQAEAKMLSGAASLPNVAGAYELAPELIEALTAETSLMPVSEPLGARLASYFGRHQLLLFILSFFCLWAILVLPPIFTEQNLAPGKVAIADYVATQSAFLSDEAETKKRRDAKSALVTPAYQPNPGAVSFALAELPDIVQKAKIAASRTKNNPNGRNIWAQIVGSPIKAETLKTAQGLSPERWNLVSDVAKGAVQDAYVRARIRSDVSTDAVNARPVLRESVLKLAQQHKISSPEASVAFELASRATRYPNVVVNVGATEEARREARNSVLPVYFKVEANTVIVHKGERISEVQWQQLQQLGLVAPRFKPVEALAYGAFCLMLVAGGAAYIGRSRRSILTRPAALWLVAVVPVVFVLIFRLILRVPHADFLMVPLAATAAMLITVLLDMRLGLPAGFVVAALCALLSGADAGLFLAATLSAWIGALSVANMVNRFAIVRSIALLAASNALLAASLGVLREAPVEEILSSVAWSAIAGGASVIAMAGLAIFIERPFGITSQLRLLELLSPDETVLRRMQLEASGTYTHSLMVALLAEAGAKTVGADSLLCRVGGLYHDIGKLRRPHCFIENQSGDNIHDRLSPGLSALLIKAHVKDGLELGRAIRLPAPVLEIIETHHGQSLISFFYNRAKTLSENGAVEEKPYRYPGPRPISKEAAIVMLADSVEASARSLPKVTPEILQTHVQTIIQDRLEQGELADCALSLGEIGAIQEAFLNTLKGAMHGRIAYPDPASLQNDGNWVAETLGDFEKPVRERVKSDKQKFDKLQDQNIAKSSENEQNKDGANEASENPSRNENGKSRQKSHRVHLKNAFHASQNEVNNGRIASERTSSKSPENNASNKGARTENGQKSGTPRKDNPKSFSEAEAVDS